MSCHGQKNKEKTQGKSRVVSTRSLPGGGARPVETKTAGWKGRMAECCAFLDTDMAALRLSWYSVGVVTSCWYSVVDVTRPPLPTRKKSQKTSVFFSTNVETNVIKMYLNVDCI